jgi:hypothetical protein
MTMREICSAILKQNGIKYQYDVAVEELSELTKELMKANRDKGSAMHICEEIADVEICLEQIKLTLPIAKHQVAMFKAFKLKRLELLYLTGREK